MINYKKIFFVLSLFLFSATLIYAKNIDVININKNTKELNIFNNIEILEDHSNTLLIEDIITSNYKKEFKPASEIGNSFGFSKSTYWIRFNTKIDKDVVESIYLELAYPLMDYATLYTLKKDGTFIENKSGEFIDYSTKEVNFRNHLFSLSKTNEVQTYYMYVKSKGSTQIPLNIISSSTLIEKVDKSNFIFGLYYGNMLLLMLVAIVSYFKIRDKIFLTYAIYLFTYITFQLSINGFFTQYFSPFPLDYANKTMAVSLGLVVFGGTLFSGTYLHIWSSKYNKIKKLFYALLITGFAGAFIASFIHYSTGILVSTIAGVLLTPIVLIGAIISLYNGYKPALYFLIAWGVFLTGVFITGLLFLGFIEHNFFTTYSMQIGSTLEVFLLSYALIDRINAVFQEKELAIRDANRYLNQMNEGLESLVTKRTTELEEKNQLLNELAIRDSMTGMLNHNASIEKLASMKATAIRYGYNLAVIMIDIDLFKLINDKFGHPAGDKVIIQIAETIEKNIRQSDASGRYGGEEFIIILHDTNLKSALELSERIRTEVASLKISEIGEQPISASLGITIFNPKTPDADLIKQADIALYEAKESGRNCIVTYH